MSELFQRAISGRLLHIPLNAKVDANQLQVKIYNQDGRHITDAEIDTKSFGEYIIKYKPPEPGIYKMVILVSNEIKRTVTIEVDPTPVARLLGSPKLVTFVNQPVEFELEVPGGIKVEQISGRFRRVGDDNDDVGDTSVSSLSDTKFVLTFVPNRVGTYHASVGIQGQGPMAGELTVEVLEMPSVTLLTSDGRAVVGHPYRWTLRVSSVPLDELMVNVNTPDGFVSNPARAQIFDNKDGTIDVVYTPERPGVYTAELKLTSGTFSNLLQMQAVYDLPQNQHQNSPSRRAPFPSITPSSQVHHSPYRQGSPSRASPFRKMSSSEVNFLEPSAEQKALPTPFRQQQSQPVVQQQPLLLPVVRQSEPEEYERDLPPMLPPSPVEEGQMQEVTIGEKIIVSITLDAPNKAIEVPIKDRFGNVVDHAHVEDAQDGSYNITYTAAQKGLFYMIMVIDGEQDGDEVAVFQVND